MTGVVRKATFLAILGLAALVSVAAAGVPDPAHCTFPTAIDLGGCNGSAVVDPNVFFTVTVRDIGNFPVANQLVAVGFNNDVKIFNAFPGFVSCQCVEATTDLSGVATFHVPGSGRNSNGVAGFTGAAAATFYAWNCGSSTVLGTANVSVFDQNGFVSTKGVEITDLGAWVADYNARATPPVKFRSDYNHSGAVDIVDLSFWVRVYNSQASKFSCGTLCP
jgi:hypothetical protein